MQIVVAGTGGFIGSEVIERALTAEHQVFALVRDQTLPNLDAEAIRQGRLVCLPLGADPEVLGQGFGLEAGARWILAAGVNRGRDSGLLHQAHSALTQEFLSAAEALAAERVVLLSCLGARAGTNEGHGLPRGAGPDPWVASKRAAEKALRASSRPWAVVRSAPVYGMGDALLDEVGAWLHRSPFIPRFLEDVFLQPLHVGDVAEVLLATVEGDLEIGGMPLKWGELLQACAQAAGKSLLGPKVSEATLTWLAETFGNRSWMRNLVPFDSEELARHRGGYLTRENALPGVLGRPPKALATYLEGEWAYRVKHH